MMRVSFRVPLINIMKCNLILAGFAKCGTSSLHEYLSLHPEICMSSVKEPHYFSVSERMSRGLEWYESLFGHATSGTRIFGESSTSYSVWEPSLVRIREQLDKPKLIVLLRDPLERLLSHYRWMYALGLEKMDLRRALALEARTVASPDIHRNGCYPWYRRCSNYSYFVPLMQMIFNRENLLVLKSSTLLDDPECVLSQCFDFLDVKPFSIETEIVSNTTEEKMVASCRSLRPLASRLPSFLKQPLVNVQDYMGVGKRKLVAPDPSEKLLASIREELVEDLDYYKNA